MILFKVAISSLLNRKATTFLTLLSLALSVCLLFGIERVRSGTRKSFESTVSGVDLIVGARSGPINLLLYSVFRIGNATNNISYLSFKEITNHKDVQWTIPISLGDSHRGYPVVGTNHNYFKHFKHSRGKLLEFYKGKEFQELFDVVLGWEVAKELGYKISDKIILSHGLEKVSFQEHDDKPFEVVGILKKTNTPVDNSLHVSLKAIKALHIDWEEGAPPQEPERILPEQLLNKELKPSDVTAFLVKLKSPMTIFNIQREVNDYKKEALMAILPGITLGELWGLIGVAEKALLLTSFFVFFVSLVGMTISLLATLNERRREMAILRSVGAKKKFVFSLLLIEVSILCLGGLLLGLVFLYISLTVFHPILEEQMGLTLSLFEFTTNDIVYLAAIFISSLLAGCVPALRAYKNSLADGLIVKN